ncbi:MAG: response regulator [Desulfatibacillaceae bacterium]|nr:response regulator [Desulfatibacillaceae bacterium]
MQDTQIKVLLVEDDHAMRDVLHKALSQHNESYQCLVAKDGNEALEILSSHAVSLVISDVMMPGMSGLTLLKKIREKHPNTDVVLMTGYGSERVREEAQTSGCNLFLEKPFRITELQRCISEFLQRRSGGFDGTLSGIVLTDLIQMCCMATLSTSIRVTNGQETGFIHIHKGEIVHAGTDTTQGEQAFYSIMSWGKGKFETLAPVHGVPKSIHSNWHSLLMEAARQEDEKQQLEELPEQKDQVAVDEDEDKSAPPVRKILVVDDSLVMCNALSEIIESHSSMEVVSVARNGEEALTMMALHKPDCITLDVNMPVMGGSTALKHIMIKDPCPVVIISNVASDGWRNIMDFIMLGAADFLAKPKRAKDMDDQRQTIASRVFAASQAKLERFKRTRLPAGPASQKQPAQILPKKISLVCSGAGGHWELISLVSSMPQTAQSCMVFFQAMPSEFSRRLATFLNEKSALPVFPLSDGAPLLAGCCYIGSSEQTGVFLRENDSLIWKEDASQQQEPGEALALALKSATAVTNERVVLGLLSGADIDEAAQTIENDRGKFFVVSRRPQDCMVPSPLEKAIAAGLVDMQEDLDSIRSILADS